MRATTGIEILETRIEQLVREHILAVRKGAEAAVARGLTGAMGSASPHPLSHQSKAKTKTTAHRPASRRRTPEEIADLTERLCAAIHAEPGATMTRLAPIVGATAYQLSIAVEHLQRQGRLRTVGQRQYTCYFPMPQKSSRAV